MALTVVCTALLLLPAADTDKPARYPKPDLLIEAGELARPDAAGRFRMLDVRTREKYQAGHVPGAVVVSPLVWAREFKDGQDKAAWARRLGELGIDVNTPVVVYGDINLNETARVWWILRYWGVKDARLLNGGWQAWQQAVGPVSREETKPATVEARLEPQAGRLATKGQVLELLKERRCQIVDSRSAAENLAGAIPEAVHLEWLELVEKETRRFKGPKDLAKVLADAGLDPRKPAVTYCQSGGRAAVMAFALELMGGKEVRNYHRSWGEWGSAGDAPVVKPKQEGKKDR